MLFRLRSETVFASDWILLFLYSYILLLYRQEYSRYKAMSSSPSFTQQRQLCECVSYQCPARSRCRCRTFLLVLGSLQCDYFSVTRYQLSAVVGTCLSQPAMCWCSVVSQSCLRQERQTCEPAINSDSEQNIYNVFKNWSSGLVGLVLFIEICSADDRQMNWWWRQGGCCCWNKQKITDNYSNLKTIRRVEASLYLIWTHGIREHTPSVIRTVLVIFFSISSKEANLIFFHLVFYTNALTNHDNLTSRTKKFKWSH